MVIALEFKVGALDYIPRTISGSWKSPERNCRCRARYFLW